MHTRGKGSTKNPTPQGVLAAQRVEHSTGVTKIVGSNPDWDSDFSVALFPVAKRIA